MNSTALAAPPAPAQTVAAPAAAEPALPADQVWQCTVNGQKVFSDKRCGAGASIRQISAVNGMDQPAPIHTPYRYPVDGSAAAYGQGAHNASAPAYDADAYQDTQANEIYFTNQVALLEERRRHEHRPPPHPQFHAPAHAHSTH